MAPPQRPQHVLLSSSDPQNLKPTGCPHCAGASEQLQLCPPHPEQSSLSLLEQSPAFHSAPRRDSVGGRRHPWLLQTLLEWRLVVVSTAGRPWGRAGTPSRCSPRSPDLRVEGSKPRAACPSDWEGRTWQAVGPVVWTEEEVSNRPFTTELASRSFSSQLHTGSTP